MINLFRDDTPSRVGKLVFRGNEFLGIVMREDTTDSYCWYNNLVEPDSSGFWVRRQLEIEEDDFKIVILPPMANE